MTLKEKLVTAKFRFDLGMSFLTIVNLALLTITASTKLQDIAEYFNVKLNLISIIFPIILCALLGTWLFGFALDNAFGYWQSLRTVQNKRDPAIQKLLNNTEQIKQLLGDKKDD